MKTTSTLYHFVIGLLLIGIVSCHSNTSQSTSHTTKLAKVENIASKSNCDTTVTNQEFGFDILAFNVFKADTNKIKSLFLSPAVLKIEKHSNDEGGTYDLQHFTDGVNDIILLFKTNEGIYIENADIKSNKFRLNSKISIGMSKEFFLKLIKVKSIKCDTITVQDDEMTFENVYIFKDGKLSEIKMGQKVE